MIDFEAVGGKSMEEQDAEDEMNDGAASVSTAVSARNNASLVEKYLLHMFERVIDQVNDIMTEKFNKMKISLNEG